MEKNPNEAYICHFLIASKLNKKYVKMLWNV